MSWLQIELRATPGSLPDLEDALLECGAVSLSLVSDADEPVLEPAPGETPLWSSVRLQALFDLNADVSRIRESLESLGLIDHDLTVAFVGPQDWQAAARGHAVDEIFGGRFYAVVIFWSEFYFGAVLIAGVGLSEMALKINFIATTFLLSFFSSNFRSMFG